WRLSGIFEDLTRRRLYSGFLSRTLYRILSFIFNEINCNLQYIFGASQSDVFQPHMSRALPLIDALDWSQNLWSISGGCRDVFGKSSHVRATSDPT
ncbi:MAG: hypothetical protein EB015_12965, partial [Methylocystaceae bacterium]|nr:hypothetical protein [Methylocystaceae bacterium]